MMRKRYGFLAICALLFFVETARAQKNPAIDAILSEFYNNFNSTESNQAVKEKIEEFIARYPKNPALYSFWASVEWILIGHELEIKISKTYDLSKNKAWAERLRTYNEIIDSGLTLVEDASDFDSIIVRAELLFEKSKLQYRFLNDIRGADRSTAELVESLQKTDNCLSYFFWGSAKFGLSTQSISKRFFIRFLSYTYEALKKLDPNVYDTKKSIEWLERTYECGYDSTHRKRIWIENAFFLANAYETYRQNLSIRKELPVLEKQIRVLSWLIAVFPEHKEIAGYFKNLVLRQNTLENFIRR